MARIRTIKPEFWIDEKIVDLGPYAQLLFIGLWNFADDQGYIDDKPRRIKMQIFPGADVDVEPLLDSLVAAGLLVRYDSPIGPVLHVRNWERHQKVDRAAQPRFDASLLVVAARSSSPREPSSSRIESSPASVDAERKGSGSGRDLEGKGRDLLLASLATPPTIPQRSKRITDAYHAVEPMSKWPAVNAIVIRAIKAERWTDEAIQAALLRMAGENRSVTVDSLRIELDGMPPSRASPGDGLVSVGNNRVRPETAARIASRERLAAMDAAETLRVIEGGA